MDTKTTRFAAGCELKIEFAQLNRPRWDRAIHGVCTPPTVHGTLVPQRLHQLLLDDQRGIPTSRTILRIDGYWGDVGA